MYQDTTGSIRFRSVHNPRLRVPICAFLGARDHFQISYFFLRTSAEHILSTIARSRVGIWLGLDKAGLTDSTITGIGYDQTEA